MTSQSTSTNSLAKLQAMNSSPTSGGLHPDRDFPGVGKADHVLCDRLPLKHNWIFYEASRHKVIHIIVPSGRHEWHHAERSAGRQHMRADDSRVEFLHEMVSLGHGGERTKLLIRRSNVAGREIMQCFEKLCGRPLLSPRRERQASNTSRTSTLFSSVIFVSIQKPATTPKK